MTTKFQETPAEKLEAANAQLVAAQTLFQKLNHKLKQFDREFPILTAELAAERESLVRLRDQAQAELSDAEQAHKFVRFEVYAMGKKWGRGNEAWRK